MAKVRLLFFAGLMLNALPAYNELSREAFCQKLPEGNICSKAQTTVWGEAPKNSVDISAGVTISLANGKKRVWANLGKHPWGMDHEFKFLGFTSPSQFFLVKGIHWGEEFEYFLASYQNGDEIKLSGNPNFAPDGKHFLVIPEDYGALPSGGDIYEITEKGIAKVGSTKFKSDLSIRPVWINENVLAVFEVRHSNKAVYSIERILVRVVHENDKWTSKYDENE